MCVILYKKNGIPLKEDLVKELWEANKDGAGFIYKKDNSWFLKKGIMDLEELLKSKHIFDKKSEVVLHLRIKTKGDVSEEHTHPFEWTPPENAKSQRLVFHNGTLKIIHPPNGDSDSSFLAKILTNVSTEEGYSILKNLSRAGSGRFVTLAENEIKLFEDSESVTHEGLWFSNGRHLTKSSVFNDHTYGQYQRMYEPDLSKKTYLLKNSSETPERVKLTEDLARFYAKVGNIPYSQDFCVQWCDENGINAMSTPLLEAALDQSKIKDCTDPLFDIVLNFKE